MADNFVTDISALSAANQRVISANAASQGLSAADYLASRGGLNPVTSKFGDSYNPNRDLTDAEYQAAIKGKSGAALGSAINEATATKNASAGGSSGGGGGGGNVTPSGLKSEAQIQAEADAAARKSERQSAYDLLYSEFAKYGLQSLVEPLKGLIISGASPAEFTIKLRESDAYQKRFAANKQRIANGFKAIDEATYLGLEDKYQSIMQNYGLPASYYTKGDMGTQPGFEKFIAGNVDPVTLEERIMEGVKINKGSQTLIDTAKEFYPNLTDGDFLAYTLDTKNALSDIKRKVTAIEIGGAATQSGLKTNVTRAEELGTAGITGTEAQQGFKVIGAGLQRGSQLASIYQETPYTQTTAEKEIFNIPGANEARKQREKITGLEKASFGGQTGITSGALARDRAGGY